jgi:hypothetical protein
LDALERLQFNWSPEQHADLALMLDNPVAGPADPVREDFVH